MDTTIGSSQASKALTTKNTSSAQNDYYTRFCSSPMSITSLSADTWNYTFAAFSSQYTLANFPVTAANSNLPVNITLYVWRPSNGTKIATILDGNSNNTFGYGGAASSEVSFTGTFAGSAVSFAANDILCFEVYFHITQALTIHPTDTFYYDGSVETNTNGTATTNQASYIESPNNTITFGGGAAAVIYPKFFSTKTMKPDIFSQDILRNVPPMFTTI